MGTALREGLRRLRHIHIPDQPPLYCPPRWPDAFMDEIEYIIRTHGEARQHSLRDTSHTPYWYRPEEPDPQVTQRFRYWIRREPPPPLVVTSTPRPIFRLPTEPDARVPVQQSRYRNFGRARDFYSKPKLDVDRCSASLIVAFPMPPRWGWSHRGPLHHHWLQVPVRPGQADRTLGEMRGGKFHWGLAQAVYQGPGMLLVVVLLDVYAERSDEAVERRMAAFQHTLEETTIAVLASEYGLKATRAADGSPGLWVESRHREAAHDNVSSPPPRRQIATIQCRKRYHAVRFYVCINVGQPTIEMVRGADLRNNPWARIRQANKITSVMAELSEERTRERRPSRELLGPSTFYRPQPPEEQMNPFSYRKVISNDIDGGENELKLSFRKILRKAKEDGGNDRPAPAALDDPWDPIRQTDKATSVMAEMTMESMEAQIRGELTKESIEAQIRGELTKESTEAQTSLSEDLKPFTFGKPQPAEEKMDAPTHSNVHRKGNKDGDNENPPPEVLGLDNYALGSAWAVELAAQLGIAHVDQLGRYRPSAPTFLAQSVELRRDKVTLDRPVTLKEWERGRKVDRKAIRMAARVQQLGPEMDRGDAMRYVNWSLEWDRAGYGMREALRRATTGHEKHDTRYFQWNWARIQRLKEDPGQHPEPVSCMALPGYALICTQLAQ